MPDRQSIPNPLSGGINIGDYAAPPSDQHYAQRNICVQTCSSPCGIDVWTENVNKERPQNVKFEVIADTKPSEEVLKVALPLLQQVHGFKRVVNGTPPRDLVWIFLISRTQKKLKIRARAVWEE